MSVTYILTSPPTVQLNGDASNQDIVVKVPPAPPVGPYPSDQFDVRVYENGTVVAKFSNNQNVVVNGFGGNDRITIDQNVNSQLTTVNGGAGNDTLVSGLSNTVYSGQDGTDIADFSSAGRAVSISLDNVQNDLTQGDACNVQTDIEVVYGSNFSDTLDARADTSSSVSLFGGTGDDTLLAGPQGGPYNAVLGGGAGNDLFYARNGGQDTIYGEGGNDTAHLDASDIVTGVETKIYS